MLVVPSSSDPPPPLHSFPILNKRDFALFFLRALRLYCTLLKGFALPPLIAIDVVIYFNVNVSGGLVVKGAA